MQETKDDHLWRIARKRAEFRKSLYSYFVVILFLWLIWWFTTGRLTGFTAVPWPVWIMLGWGMALAKQWYSAFKNEPGSTNKEYRKLKREEDEV